MERLSFDSSTRYSGLEAAVHLGRYAIVRNLCPGKRVLDVACGEDYGSRFMADWGAAHVTGVDVSADAVGSAARRFASGNVAFLQGDAEEIASLLAGQSFDLIVSFETIEHLREPRAFLQGLRSLLAPGGSVVISCPNDWWYYPSESERNPFHIYKYRFSEFKILTESVLGSADWWGLGTAVAGFHNFGLQNPISAAPEDSQMRMMDAKPTVNCHVVPSTAVDRPDPSNCSYFFGVWGVPAEPDFGAAIMPVTMDVFKSGLYAGSGGSLTGDAADRLSHAEQLATDLQQRTTHLESDLRAKEQKLREVTLQLAALSFENQVLKDNIKLFQQTLASNTGTELLSAVRDRWGLDWHSIGVGAWRYFRVRDLIPVSMRNLLIKAAKMLREWRA